MDYTAFVAKQEAEKLEFLKKLAAEKEKKEKKAADKDGEFWASQKLIAELPQATGKSAVKLQLCTKDDKEYLDLRKFVAKKGETGFVQHTLHGISLELESLETIERIAAELKRIADKRRAEMRKVASK